MALANSLYDLIGNTPLLRISNFEKSVGAAANIYAKIEGKNPAGGIKDRVAYQMIIDAEEKGLLKAGSTIIEPTSGNTGLGLAAIGAVRGYKVILTMPESMSIERRKLIASFGAEIVLTPAADGMTGAVKAADEIAAKTKDSFVAHQFENPSNPRAHYLTTAPEIWRDLDGRVGAFVASVGTGGTFSGITTYLKEKNLALYAVAVEPTDSPLLSKGEAHPHKIQGIGANFVPENLNRTLIDEIITASTEQSFDCARILAKREGVLCGISAGAALHAAAELAKRPNFAGKNIVVILPDGGEKYLSTDLFN